MTIQTDAKKLELITDGSGFRVYDGDNGWQYAVVWFPDLDAAKGLLMLDKLRDELQAVVLDKLVEEGGQ